MLSSKFNETQRIQIWREHLRKEAKLEVTANEFAVNVRTLNPIAAKPTEVDPRLYFADDGTSPPSSAGLSKFTRKAEQPDGYPDSGSLPMTTANEIGWGAQVGMDASKHKQPRDWHRPLKACDETQYSRAYVSLFHRSPFAK